MARPVDASAYIGLAAETLSPSHSTYQLQGFVAGIIVVIDELTWLE
jgi:hypothetical protein